MSEAAEKTRFQVFRAKDAPTLEQSHVLKFDGITPTIAAGLKDFVKAGGAEGSYAKILINVPGFSLAYAWHKSDYPLPLHTHDVDCCYLVIAGTLTVGNETLGKGDGFFVPAKVAYTFVTGEEGVEFIEFRTVTSWNIEFRENNPWGKIAAKADARHESWKVEKPPFDLTAVAAE